MCLLVLELVRAAEVVARREVRPGARHDDDARLVVLRRRAECLVELEYHHAALGVEHLGPVRRDAQHGSELFVADGAEVHGVNPPASDDRAASSRGSPGGTDPAAPAPGPRDRPTPRWPPVSRSATA